MFTPHQQQILADKDVRETEAVRALGDQIGYGRMMQLAQQCGRTKLIAEGHPEGGEFAYGPCVALTVPCGCSCSCDWCNGSGWLTPKVAEARRLLEGT